MVEAQTVAGERLKKINEVLDVIDGSKKVPSNPVAVALLISPAYDLRNLLLNPPAKSAAERPTYDRAIKVLGGEGKSNSNEVALAALADIIANQLFGSLSASLKDGDPAGKVLGPKLYHEVYDLILASLDTARFAEFWDLQPYYAEIQSLSYLFEAKRGPGTKNEFVPISVDAEQELTHFEGQFRVYDKNQPYPANMADVKALQKITVDAFGGNAAAATNFVGLLGVAVALADASLAERQQIGKQIGTAASSITSQNISGTSAFQSMIAAFNNGDLKTGLAILNNPHNGFDALRASYSALNEVITVALLDRGVAIFDGNVATQLLFSKKADYDRFVHGFSPDMKTGIIALELASRFSEMVIAGEVSKYAITIDKSGALVSTLKGKSQVQGTAQEVTLTPAMTIAAAGAFKEPLRINLYVSGRYTHTDLNATIPYASGANAHVNLGGDSFSLGVWGIDIERDEISGQHRTFRLRSVEAGGIDTPWDKANFFAQFTLEGNIPTKNDRVKVAIDVTPTLSYLVGNIRAGGRLRPAELEVRLKKGLRLHAGVESAVEFNATTGVTSIEVAGDLGIGNRIVEGFLRGGYAFEAGGQPSQMLPSSPFLGVGLRINAPTYAQVPRKIAQPKTLELKQLKLAFDAGKLDELKAIYLEALGLKDKPPSAETKGAALALSAQLGDILGNYAINQPDYYTALSLLKKGKLREGMDILSTLRPFDKLR